MQNGSDDIVDHLVRLGEQAPSGFALGLQIRFASPTYLFQTYPADWIAIYSKRGYAMVDPTVRWAWENTGTVRWSAIDLPDPSNVLTEAAEFGLVYGIASVVETDDTRSLCTAARPDREFTDGEMADWEKEAHELHRRTGEGLTLSPASVERMKKLSIFATHP